MKKMFLSLMLLSGASLFGAAQGEGFKARFIESIQKARSKPLLGPAFGSYKYAQNIESKLDEALALAEQDKIDQAIAIVSELANDASRVNLTRFDLHRSDNGLEGLLSAIMRGRPDEIN